MYLIHLGISSCQMNLEFMFIPMYQRWFNISIFWNLFFLEFLPELLIYMCSICITKLKQWLITFLIWSLKTDFLKQLSS